MKRHSLSLLCFLLAAGCVSQGKYDGAVADGQRASAALDARNRELAESRTASQKAYVDLVEARSRLDELRVELDTAAAANAQMRQELEKSGKNVDQLLSEKGIMSNALDDARARLEELRRARQMAESRAALFRDLALKFQRMIDAGELSIVLREGRMVLRMPNDILFDSGRAEIKPTGRTVLKQVAAVLRTIGNRRFQVAGHTDAIPIQTALYASNWELSSARATAVLKSLLADGLKPEAVSAAGYGEFDPVANNGDEAGRSKNRRVEITVVPNIDEIVSVPANP
jgi:chemotaxis protein MotB